MKKLSLLLLTFIVTITFIPVLAAEDGVRFGERPFIDIYQIPDEAIEEGHIRIQFRRDYTEHLDNILLSEDEEGIIQFGISEIDELNRYFQVRESRKLFDSPALKNEYEWRHRQWGFHLWYELHFESREDIRDIVMAYRELKDIIEWAEPEYMKRLLAEEENSTRWTPNDPQVSSQWHYNNTGQYSGTPGADISLFDAWNIEKGHTNVIVAVIDGGIQYDHPDLAGNMWSGIGYNFVTNSSNISPHFHGTHVAGTVAAVNNNNTGVAGVAGGSGSGNGVRLMSCQVFTSNSSGGFSTAMIYAADNGAAISQNSWGYTNAGAYEQAVLDAIDYFNANGGGSVLDGGITIVAAGNDNDNGAWYPGYYSGAFAVASTTNTDTRAYYSNYGTWIDISAPGGETISVTQRGVLSTYTNSGYQYLQGTSMACPHASGAAGLVISYAHRNGLTLINSDVADILRDTTDYIGLNQMGTGRLNAYAALQYVEDLLTGVMNPADFSATIISSSHIQLTWNRNIDNDDVMLVWSSDGQFGEPSNGTVYSPGQTLPGGGIVLYRGSNTIYDHTGLQEGTTYYYKAFSYNSDNDYSSGVTAEAIPSSNISVDIGTGLNTNSGMEAAPINIYYRSLRGQMVYTVSEIEAAGFSGPGTITRLGFYVTGAPNLALPDFIIRMKHTTATDASSHDNGPYDIVYTTTSYAPTSGDWDLLELDIPFEWNGLDNILVDTAFDLVPSWSSTGTQRVTSMNNGFRFVRSDNSNQTNSNTTTTENYKPHIRFIFSSPDTPDLPEPTGLTAESGNGVVDLSWSAPDSETPDGYNVYRNGVMINLAAVLTTEYEDITVTNGVTYQYYVTALYPEGESEASNTVTATPEAPYLPEPTNLTAMAGNEVVYLYWSAPETGSPDGYNVYRDDSVINTNLIIGLEYEDNDVDNGITYQYYVTAVYEEGESLPSNTVTATPEAPLLEPPSNLTASVLDDSNILLEWIPPDIGTTIHWDSGINSGSVGIGAAAEFKAASRFSPSHLNDLGVTDNYLTKVSFFPREINCLYTINVWTGGTSTEPGNLVIEQLVIDPVIDDWNTVVLDTPVYIAPDQELWIGYNVDTQSGYPAGCDDGPALDGIGNMMYWGDTWTTLLEVASTLDYNWNIQGFVSLSSGRDIILSEDTRNRPSVIIEDTYFSTDQIPEFAPALSRVSRTAEEIRQTLTGYRLYRNGDQIVDVAVNETSYLDEDLLPGDYVYYLTALYAEGESEPSNSVLMTIDPLVLNPPQSLTAIARHSLVELEWQEPEPQELTLLGYNIYRNGSLVNQEIHTEQYYDDYDVINNLTYQYFVTAVYDEGESDSSNIAEATPYELNSPYDLIATPYHNAVELTWEEPLPLGITRSDQRLELLGFNVYRNSIQINNDIVLIPEYVDNDVINEDTYEYYVTAVYDEGESEASNTADATPYDLNPPQDLVATAHYNLVELEWDAPVPQGLTINGYNIYRDDVMINTSPVVDLEFEDSDVINGVTYQYHITALYDEGESEASNTVEATPEEPLSLDPPENLTITIDNGELTVSWDMVLNADYYIVEATDDINTEFSDISSERGYFSENGNRVSWTMQIDENEQKLFYRVKAAN